MKLVEGKRYYWWYVRVWIYDGLYDVSICTCDDCGKERKKLHWFHAEDNKDDSLKLGTECVKEMTKKPRKIRSDKGTRVGYTKEQMEAKHKEFQDNLLDRVSKVDMEKL